MKVYWVSTGRTQQGEKIDSPNNLNTRLTPEGVHEIKSICTSFEDCINVYTSPAASAIETASILFNSIGFKADGRLLQNPMDMLEGEVYEIQYERVKDFIQEVRIKQEDAIVICHEGIIQMALCYVLDETLGLRKHFRIHTGTVVVTAYEANQWVVEMSRKHY